MNQGRATSLRIREQADLLAALAHPIRLQILTALASSEDRPAGSVVEELGLPQPMVSRHLAVLRRAGVLSAVRDGRQREYRIARPEVTALIQMLDDATKKENGR
jgi:ArsR family transcriptional regulator